MSPDFPHSPEQPSGKPRWLGDPGRPCVFWLITGFGILSAGRGHAVETGVLEPVPRRGPILLLLILLLSFTLSALPPPLLRRLQCVLRLVQAKPFPLRNSLGLFLLCSFISYFFLFTLRLFFFCIILIWRLKHSSFLTHLCMLLSCHIKGLNARLFEKIAGVTLHC